MPPNHLSALAFFAVVGLYIGLALLFYGFKSVVEDTSDIRERLMDIQRCLKNWRMYEMNKAEADIEIQKLKEWWSEHHPETNPTEENPNDDRA